MPVPNFNQFYVQDTDLSRLQMNVARVLDPLADTLLLQGRLVGPVDLLAAGLNYITHGLGRALQGFCLADLDSNSVVWRDTATTNPDAKNLILLNCSADCSVKLWVF